MASSEGPLDYSRFFDMAPHELWNARATIPGFQSVMSLSKDNEISAVETNTVQGLLHHELQGEPVHRALEIGTGIGRLTNVLALHARQVVSVDLSENMLSRARDNIHYKNIALVQAVGQTLPFPDQSFDKILETTVLIHVDDDVFGQLLSEAKRVLSVGGNLLLSGPMASGEDQQKHPYLKHRTLQTYENALPGFRLNNHTQIPLSNVPFHLLNFQRMR